MKPCSVSLFSFGHSWHGRGRRSLRASLCLSAKGLFSFGVALLGPEFPVQLGSVQMLHSVSSDPIFPSDSQPVYKWLIWWCFYGVLSLFPLFFVCSHQQASLHRRSPPLPVQDEFPAPAATDRAPSRARPRHSWDSRQPLLSPQAELGRRQHQLPLGWKLHHTCKVTFRVM